MFPLLNVQNKVADRYLLYRHNNTTTVDPMGVFCRYTSIFVLFFCCRLRTRGWFSPCGVDELPSLFLFRTKHITGYVCPLYPFLSLIPLQTHTYVGPVFKQHLFTRLPIRRMDDRTRIASSSSSSSFSA